VKFSIKEWMPRRLKSFVKGVLVSASLLSAYRYDFKRYRRHSSSVNALATQQNLAAMITERYHSVEKGLSLPNPRSSFGKVAIGGLLGYLRTYLDRYGEDHITQAAVSVLDAYLRFNLGRGVEVGAIPYHSQITAMRDEHGMQLDQAGAVSMRKSEIARAVESVDLEFFTRRYSIRQFATTPVDPEDILFAARAAQKSPAVCNRQFSKIYAFTDATDIEKLLSVQGGANGFGGELRGLAIITTDLRNYWNDGQRNQAWVDGGLFSMSFLLGLHARGLGAVSLNWSKSPKIDQSLRSVASIPQEEVIVMLVGFGNLRDEFSVASSPRAPIENILFVK
jgi:nitroreductase